jgi:putative sugar O-methyltransferase
MDLTKDLINNFETVIQSRIILKNNSNKFNKNIWFERMDSWFFKVIKNNKINWDMLKNFRRHALLLTEVPYEPQSRLKSFFRSIIRNPADKKYCYTNFEKLLLKGYEKNLKNHHFSHVGNPHFYIKDGIKFNERWLRHVRSCELFKKYIEPEKLNKINVIDIGGGYSQFSCMLKNITPVHKIATVDYIEQLFFSFYFIKINYPSCRINTLQEVIDADIIDQNFIEKFDFLLIPIQCFAKIKNGLFNIVCNFSSLGEMPKDTFDSYINSDVIKKANFLFTINRLDSWPTYNNQITILDYKLQDYNIIHQSISPLWDSYYTSFTNFIIKKVNFESRNFEFIGKK